MPPCPTRGLEMGRAIQARRRVPQNSEQGKTHMPPDARIGVRHTCPRVDPWPKPLVGGPILTGEPTILIGGIPCCECPSD